MARLRTIKPGFFLDEDLAECQPLARLLFAGLWTIADREGRLEDRPRRIKAAVLPYDDCDGDTLLGELAERGFIVRYEACGARYIAIPSWSRHQNPHVKETASTIPAPEEHSALPGGGSDKPGGFLSLGSCLLEPEELLQPAPVDNSDPGPDPADQEHGGSIDPDQEQDLPPFPVALCGAIKRAGGATALDAVLADGSDLNLTARRYVLAVSELVDALLGHLPAAKLEAARDKALRGAFTDAEHTKPDNLAAYLTASRSRATHLGDLIGDELVAELLAIGKTRKGRNR